MHKKFSISLPFAILFLLVWFLAWSVLTGSWPLIRSDGEWKTITHLEYGFSLDYPTKWHAKTYGEHGFKGEDEIKLAITRSYRDIFEIGVHYQAMPQPTLKDAINWGNSRIDDSIARLRGLDKPANYQELIAEEVIINGHTTFRQRFVLGDNMYEDIYIARTNDIIIITLQANESDFESYLEDFNAIVASFRPLE